MKKKLFLILGENTFFEGESKNRPLKIYEVRINANGRILPEDRIVFRYT